jgi:tetratricopeptide (TPR) repeat protein
MSKTSHPQSRSGHPGLILCMGMVVVAGMVYYAHAPALEARALAIDDHQYLVNNSLVRHPSGRAAWQFLSEVRSPSTVGGYYQPLTMISLMLDTAMGGDVDNLWVYHRTSLALHIVNTLLVILLLYLLFDDPVIAACVGLLFGVHPMTVEPIPWIGERKTLLAAFFALGSTIAYVKYVNSRVPSAQSAIRNPPSTSFWYAMVMAFYILALLSKPTSTMLPLAFLLMDMWPLHRFNKSAIIEKAPFLLIGAVSSVFTYVSQAATFVETPVDYGPLRIPLVICHNIVFYLYKMLWPVSLSAFYPYPQPLSLANPVVLAGLIGTIALIATLLFLWKRNVRPPLIAWLIFMVILFPTLGVIGFTVVIASDKYVYLPAIGLLMLLAWAFQKAIERRSPSAGLAMIAMVLIVAGIEARGSRAYLQQWQTTERLYAHMISLAPGQPGLHFAQGHHYQFVGRPDAAMTEYQRALELDPSRRDARLNAAGILLDRGDAAGALAHYDKLLSSHPDDVEALNNRGLALIGAGNVTSGLADYKRALELRPNYAEAHNNLGMALGRQGDLDGAVTEFQTAIKIREDFLEAWKNLAAAYWRQGRMKDAVGAYQSLYELHVDDAEVNLLLARAWKAAGHNGKAQGVLQAYSARHPGHVEIEAELSELTKSALP